MLFEHIEVVCCFLINYEDSLHIYQLIKVYQICGVQEIVVTWTRERHKTKSGDKID